jgi:hypothetical protein
MCGPLKWYRFGARAVTAEDGSSPSLSGTVDQSKEDLDRTKINAGMLLRVVMRDRGPPEFERNPALHVREAGGIAADAERANELHPGR